MHSQKELVHDCSINRVPFPALETLEDRKMFPKRYFVFFDLFVRAGRHNRELWKKAIKDNKGVNNMRFGPAIFEAHVRTTVRENYFKWILQQLSDIHDVEDDDIDKFQMEYDDNGYTDLPRALVCTHKDITRFPFKNCEIDYAEPVNTSKNAEDEDDSYCSASSVDQPVDIHPNPANEGCHQDSTEKKFFLVYWNTDNKQFNKIRERQQKDLATTIEKHRGQYNQGHP